MLGLADMRQITDRLVYVAPAVQYVLPLLDGNRTLEDIARETGRGLTTDILKQLIAQFDDAGFLFGPRFDAILAKMRADFDSAPNLPPAATASMADALVDQGVQQGGEAPPADDAERQARGVQKLTALMDQWIAAMQKDGQRGAFPALPKAIVAPHLDYARGWMNYASVWGRLKGLPRPDRVVILGTNHFGMATGVCGCDKGFESPLGVCEVDTALVGALRNRLGESGAARLFENRYDHEREHSIELQIPWLQHAFGAPFPKVFAALVHDPVANNGESYDGTGLAFEPFVTAMQQALADVGGTTLVVSSADLSHVGPSFGDQQPLAGDGKEATEARNKVFAHDRDMLQMIADVKPDDLIGSMSWQQNPTRWCSIGNLTAAMKITRPTRVELLNYAASIDPQGYTCVSSVSMVMS